jgi:type I restriction enzyme S subunit
LIANNRRRIEILEATAQALYREWFVRHRFPGHESVELVQSAAGPIPLSWDLVPLSRAVEINPPVQISRGREVPFLSMADVQASSMIAEPSETRPWSGSGARFLSGDTLFARITPSLEHGKTVFVHFLDDGDPGAGSTEFIVMRGRLLGAEHVYLLARDEIVRAQAIASMSGASGRQRVRLSCFDSLAVAVPPPDVSRAFAAAANPLFKAVASLFSLSARLESVQRLLLPRLVTGQIDVESLGVDDVFGWAQVARSA